jgi:Arc/MetJ-type ribon-helix-helix transcriptional regulator
MARSIISISLPKWMGEYVQAEISEGGYDSVSEYFRELIRDYRQKKLSERKQEATLRRYKTEHFTAFIGRARRAMIMRSGAFAGTGIRV